MRHRVPSTTPSRKGDGLDVPPSRAVQRGVIAPSWLSVAKAPSPTYWSSIALLGAPRTGDADGVMDGA